MGGSSTAAINPTINLYELRSRPHFSFLDHRKGTVISTVAEAPRSAVERSRVYATRART